MTTTQDAMGADQIMAQYRAEEGVRRVMHMAGAYGKVVVWPELERALALYGIEQWRRGAEYVADEHNCYERRDGWKCPHVAKLDADLAALAEER